MRAFPFSQVKSANAKGSAFGATAAPVLPFSVAWDVLAPIVGVGAAVMVVEAAAPAGVAALSGVTKASGAGFADSAPGPAGVREFDSLGLAETVSLPALGCLASSYATLFSSCSTRSSSHCSRSVSPEARSDGCGFDAGLAAESVVFPSSEAFAEQYATEHRRASTAKHKIEFRMFRMRIETPL